MTLGARHPHILCSPIVRNLFLCFFFWFLSSVPVGEAAADFHEPLLSASEVDYPPFCLLDGNGRADGFSVELMRAALAAMNRQVTFRVDTWTVVRGWLENGTIQALPLVGRTPEREAIFDFTVPYMSMYGAIVVRDDSTDIQDLTDLRNRSVAVMKGDNAEEFLRREERGIQIHTTETFQEALRDLSQGRFDAVVIQRLVGTRLIQETGLKNLKIVNRPIEGFRQDFCFAVREGDRSTLALLNEGLALVIADGTYRHLHAKWFAALELPANRRIVVGGDRSYPPYEYLDDSGRPAGFTVDLTRAIAREMGLEIEFRLRAWDEAVQDLENGSIDVIQGMFYSPHRGLKFDFSPPYAMNQYVGVVLRGKKVPPDRVTELTGSRIAVQRGDVVWDSLVQAGLENGLVAAENQEDALQMVLNGKADCAVVVRIGALEQIRRHHWTDLKMGSRPLFLMEYGYAVPKGHHALLATFSEGLNVLKTSGEYRQIHDKWLGVYQETGPRLVVILRWIGLVAGPLLIGLLAFVAWSWTLRKQVAVRTAQLRQTTEQYRLLADNTLDAIWTMNLDLEFTYINPACYPMTGFHPEEWIGTRLSDHCDQTNLELMTRVVEDALERGAESEGLIFEAEMLKKNGAPIWVEIHGKVLYDRDGQAVGLQGTTRDISERKLQGVRIDHLNRVLRAIRDINQLIVRERNSNRLIQEACRLLVENRGYPSALIVLTDAENRPIAWALAGDAAGSEDLQKIFESGSRVPCFDHVACREGTLVVTDREAICSGCPLVEDCMATQSLCASLSYEGRISGYLAAAVENRLVLDDEEKGLFGEMAGDLAYALGFIQMEAQRKEGEEALRESESRFRMLADLAPVGILISDRRGEVIYASPKFTDLFGYTKEDLPSMDRWWLLSGPDETERGKIRKEWEAAMAEAIRTKSEMRPLEFPVACKDRTVRQIEFRGATSGHLNFVVFVDVTERRRGETEREKLHGQLLQAQKMEAIGRLAGGVAHDFNNMLNVIMGYAELGMTRLKPSDPLHGNLEEILSAAHRSADITRQLLAFARKQTVKPGVLDLNDTIESMLKMLRPLIGEDIDLRWMPGVGLWTVLVDPSQISQILANLCVNARDAISGVGKVTIETHNVRFDRAYCEDHAGCSPGDFVMLVVSDDGEGMDSHALSNLFEPFFTTKKMGHGTGLGLATVYGIVKQNNGFINVYSEPGQGTTFRIYLPRHVGAAEERVPEAEEIRIAGNNETILVVEDEGSVLKLTTVTLEELGYTVLSAGNPVEADRLAESHAGPIDLLISDVVMPVMNGRELADRIRMRHPEMKTIFMSGYTANVIAHRGVLDEGVNFLQKPFSRMELAGKVREVLGT
jgi:PAS domain S-box-containing protein